MKQKTRTKRDLVLALANYMLESRDAPSALASPPDIDDVPDRKTPGVQVSQPQRYLPPIGIYGVIPIHVSGPSPTPIFITPSSKSTT